MANDFYSWIEAVEDLSDASLTVRAQALPENDRDRLIHPLFFPRTDVSSVKLENLLTTDYRPASDRRDWNTRGRLIPLITPTEEELEMVPIEGYFTLAEREMQELVERFLDDERLIRQMLGVDIPSRTDTIVFANRRREEFDAFEAWLLGIITAMNPQSGQTYVVSYGFDTDRYQTAGTAWDTVANAYTEFLAWVTDGADAIGANPIGVLIDRLTYGTIQADAPQGANLLPLTRNQFEQQVRSDLGYDFTFYLIEHRLDKFTDGGLTVARTRVTPAGVIALIPPGVAIGDMAHAPVARAFGLARVNQDAEIDVRGQSVFKEVAGNGRSVTVEVQKNSMPRPNENNLWVMDTLVVP